MAEEHDFNEEEIVCPSRVSQGRKGCGKDYWHEKTWSHYCPKHNPHAQGWPIWNWSWEPRTCSYCLGIHPDDAVKLLEEGWEVETTGKSYKRYLNPPGTSQRTQRLIKKIREKPADPKDCFKGVPSVWGPAPPVKVYLWHFAEDDAKRFNDALDEQRGNKPA